MVGPMRNHLSHKRQCFLIHFQLPFFSPPPLSHSVLSQTKTLSLHSPSPSSSQPPGQPQHSLSVFTSVALPRLWKRMCYRTCKISSVIPKLGGCSLGGREVKTIKNTYGMECVKGEAKRAGEVGRGGGGGGGGSMSKEVGGSLGGLCVLFFLESSLKTTNTWEAEFPSQEEDERGRLVSQHRSVCDQSRSVSGGEHHR